jgi:predicted dienelactone hydrolase
MKKWHALLFLPVLLGISGYWFAFVPASAAPNGEQSLARFTPGPHHVVTDKLDLVDDTRKTQPNNEYPGRDGRVLKGELWRPEKLTQPGPLLIYSHGFMSFHQEGLYLVRFLASHGYTVAAVDYPLTNYFAPGKPLVTDVVNQPGDVSFLITKLLERNDDPHDVLHGTIDPKRIAVAGVSLGGLTSTLAAFHPKVRDPRIAAVVSIAGPTVGVTAQFFAGQTLPFLMIASDADAIVHYDENAAPIPTLDPGSILVTLKDGSHSGFAQAGSTFMRFNKNPDVVGCNGLMSALKNHKGDPDVFLPGLDGEEYGIKPGAHPHPCSAPPIAAAMPAARQHMFATLAAYAFFESVFAPDPSARTSARQYLLTTLPAENSAEVRVSGG